MLRRPPSDAALLIVALSTIALVIGTTFLLHHVFVGEDVTPTGTTAVHTAVDVTR